MKIKMQDRSRSQSKRMVVIMLLFLVPLTIMLALLLNMMRDQENKLAGVGNQPQESHFRIDGTLKFLSADNDSITSIFIEIADTPQAKEKGLMHRFYMPDTVGMLFVYHEEQYQGFWMKDTHFSLDILYANKNFEIVTLYEKTTPESEETLPSGEKAKYVIEVRGGFVKQHGIKAGDKFSYKNHWKKDRN
jgi:uncharacterized protein